MTPHATENMGGRDGPPNPPGARTRPGEPGRGSTRDSFTGSEVIRSASLAVLVALVAAGCAGVSEVTGTASQQDLLQIQADIAVLQANQQRAKTEIDKQTKEQDARAQAQATQTQERLDDLGRRVEALSTTLASLTGRVDELNGQIETLNRRLASTPSAGSSAPRGETTETPAGTSAPPPPGRTPAGIQPQDVFQTAYSDFSKGSYQLAIAGFRDFLRRYPDHELAGAAQYWIGEAHWSLARLAAGGRQPERGTQDLERAVQEFRKVLANYPRSDKAPTALYKEALALLELKQPAAAQSRLQFLIETFPQAEEASLARERLATLRSN